MVIFRKNLEGRPQGLIHAASIASVDCAAVQFDTVACPAPAASAAPRGAGGEGRPGCSGTSRSRRGSRVSR